MKRIIALIALTFVLATGSAYAADASGAVDIYSAYVWRGYTLNEEAVIQPSMDITKGGFGFNVWGNFDVIDDDDDIELADTNQFSEVDLTLSYSLSVGKLDFGVGIIEYLFPYIENDGAESAYNATREIYASVGVNIIEGLSAGVAYYRDVDEVEDYYATFSLSYGFSIAEKLEVALDATVGYAGEDFAQSYGGDEELEEGFHDYALSLGLTYPVTEALSIGATYVYVDTLDEDVLAEDAVIVSSYGGINIAYAF